MRWMRERVRERALLRPLGLGKSRSPPAFVLHDGNGAMDNHVSGALTGSLQRKAVTEYTMDIESIWDA